MVERETLVRYCNELLDIDAYQDYCPNGLQIEGRKEIRKIVSGVTACEALIDAAIAAKADLLLVHHGYFWKGEEPVISGIKRRRIGKILEAGINLLAYHLPLDGHPELGNNAQLGKLLAIDVDSCEGLVFKGVLSIEESGEAFAERLATVLRREPMHIPVARSIRTVAWCSGGAQGYLEGVAQQGIDAYISGEISEQSVHIAREYGIHYYAAGHHATERGGVQALGEHIAKQFDIEHIFVDIDNPV